MREALELLLVRAVGDALPERVVHDEHLEVTDSSTVAGVEAVVAATAVIEDPPRARRQSRGRKLIRGHLLDHLTVRADPAQQSLRDDATYTRRNQVRRDAHVL